MRRALTAIVTMTLTTGFVVVDVVDLPNPARPVAPQVGTIGLSASDGFVLSGFGAALASASASVSQGATPIASLQPPVVGERVGPAASEVPAVVEPSVEPAPDGKWFVSRQLETQDFSVAGITWATGASDPGAVEIRLREDDGWTGWTSLDTNDEGPDAGTAEYDAAFAVTGTDPLVTDGADAVQVRVHISGGSLPDDLQVVVIDPGTSPADATLDQSVPLSGAEAEAYRPTIISRAQWGADESLRNCSPSSSGSIKAAVIHHTAGDNSYSAAESAAVVRGIYAYHTRSLGWCDIGYNFLVDKYGRILEGRAGGVDRPVVGAHSGGFNANTLGVGAMGNYSTAATTDVMVTAIADVVGWKLALAGVSPAGSTTLTSAGGGTSRYSAGAVVQLPTVLGHRDVGVTACPGANLYAALGTIRSRALSLVEQANFVRALYADMLNRIPGSSEVAYWVPRLSEPNGPARVAGGFSGSEEYRKRSIRAAYVDVLGREPDPQGLEHWYQAVLANRAQIDGIRPFFLGSQEFYIQAGGTEDGWISLLFTRALKRQPSAGDLTHWRGVLRTQGRDTVISGIYNSGESAGVRVDRAYQAWLGRTAGGWERDYWMNLVITQGDETMRQAVMTSTEYWNRAQTR